MAKYLISFPSAAMIVPDGEWEVVGRDSHAVIDEAKAAGVYVFGGGIDEDVPPVLVSANGAVAEGGYPWAPPLDGGFTVLELPSREEAVAWAARIAKACRCDQELRVFQFDPQSSGLLACGHSVGRHRYGEGRLCVKHRWRVLYVYASPNMWSR
jgi:hypothetical protein